MALYRDPADALRRLAAGEVPEPAAPPTPVAIPDAETLRREGLLRRYEGQSESGRAFQQGLENVRASGQGARGLVRVLVGDEAGGLDDLRLAQRTQAEAGEFGPQVQTLEDIDGLGSGAAYARNIALQQAPNLALAAAGGLVGGAARIAGGSLLRGATETALARGIASGVAQRRGAATVERELVDRARRRLTARLPQRAVRDELEQGAKLGGAAVGSVLQSGMAPGIVLDTDPNNTASVRERAGAAAVGALATGALEALPVAALFRRYGLTGAEEAVRGSVLSRIAQQGARQGTTEAVTEVAQQVGERTAHKWVNDNVELMGPEAYSEYLNAAAGGFVGGGLFGAPAGLRGAGRDSDAGRSYTAGLREVTGRLKAARDKLRPSSTPDAGARPPPGSPVSESDPVDLRDVVSKAATFAKSVAEQAGPAIKGVGEKLGEVGRQFNKTVDDLTEDTVVDHSISDILDADPYQLKTDANGLSTFNDGAGAPFAQFADAQRARRYVLAGDDGGLAAVKSTLPEGRVDELTQSGAVGAALNALRGRLDKIDDAKLIQYEDALPEEARPMFHRAAATALQANKDGVQLAAREPGSTQAEPTAAQKAVFVNDEEAPLRRAQESVKFVREASGGLLREGAKAPANHFVVTGQATGKDGAVKTVQRAISGQALGKLVQQVRKADTSLDTRAALATVVSDLQLGGLNVDPASLKAGLQLGKDWYLTPAMAATVVGDSAPTAPRRATAPTKRATLSGLKTDEEVRALNAEFGRGDNPGVRGVEGRPKTAPVGPLVQRPGELRVSPTGKVTPAQKIDAGTTDTATLREERKQFEPDAFNEIDQLLERHTGETVNSDFDRRRDLYKQAIAKLPKGGAQRAELQAAAVRFGEAMATAQKNKVNAALKTWQANKSPKTKAALDKARDNYERTLDSVTRSGTGELPSLNRTTPEMQELRQAQIDEDNVRAGSQQQPLSKEAKLAQTKAPRKAAAKKKVPTDKVVANALGNEGFGRWQNELAAKPAATFVPEFATRAAPEAMREQLGVVRAQIDRDSQRGVLQTGLFYEQAELEHMLGDDMIVDYSATNTPAGLDKAIEEVGQSRSRRGLYALKQRVLDSTLSASDQIDALLRINAKLAGLRNLMESAGRAENSRTTTFDSPVSHFIAGRDALLDAKTMNDGLAAVRELANASQRKLIDTLLGMEALRGVSLSAIIDPERRDNSIGGTHWSSNNPSKATKSRVEIEFGLDRDGALAADPVRVLLHEAVHAATVWAEQHNPETQKAVEALLNHVRAQAKLRGVDPNSFYGLSETQEFMAEAFTNSQLQNIMREIPALNTDKFASLWDEFKDFVAKLLGFKKDAPSALDEVFTLALDLARETAAKRAEAFEALTGEDVADYSATAIAKSPAAGSQPTDYMALLQPNERRYLDGAFRRGDVLRQIAAALPADLQTTLMSADEGPRLLVNTGVALALQGRLNLTHNPRSVTGAINGLWEIVSKVLQVPSKAAYARAILTDLREGVAPGKVDVQAKLLAPAALDVTRFMQTKIAPKVSAFARDIDARMRSTGVPALAQIATLISQRTGEFRSDRNASYVARRTAQRNKLLNDFYKIIGGWDDAKKAAVMKALQENSLSAFTERKGALEDVTGDVAQVRDFFKQMRDYLTQAGLKLGNTENYFPVAIDSDKVAENADAFIKLMSAPNFAATLAKRKLTPQGLYTAASTASRSTQVADLTFADGEHDPTFRPLNKRLMDFVYKEGTPEQIVEFAQFQDQNLDRVVVNYVNRAVRRAEWTRLNIGEQLSDLMGKAKTQGATDDQMQMARDYVDQVMGSYGADWHPWIKTITDKLGVNLPPFERFQSLSSALITYQNVRLLPLAALSSLIDPLGVAVRSGGTTLPFGAYRDALRAMRDTHGNDTLRGLAEDMGIVERHAVSEALIYMFGGANEATGTSAKVNAALFRFNGLEYITKFSRLAALAAGNRFLLTHATSNTARSKRYLNELNLTPADIVVGPDGFVLRNEKIDAALTRFVDESVVRPTPTQRPQWHNDPHFALAAQYKGYLYSFWNTVVRRAGVELQQGNPRVLLPLMMYLPITAMGEMARDMAQGDDEDRDAKAYAALSLQRSGLLGPHINLLQNAQQDLSFGHSILNSVAGPTGQQLAQAYDAANGERGFARTALEALPASALYEDWTQ